MAAATSRASGCRRQLGSALEQRKREKRSELSRQGDNTRKEVGARQADQAYRDLQSKLVSVQAQLRAAEAEARRGALPEHEIQIQRSVSVSGARAAARLWRRVVVR